MAEGSHKPQDELWRVLEFYSGIGGMRYSLMKAGVNAKVVEAFDINDKANDVYEHNFGHRPYQGNIQSLTAADLDSYGAQAWLLSPPCQPYTRQGLQKHSGDARALSFLKILELIPHTSKPPSMLFVENVVGFETSDTHTEMIDILAKTNFVVQEFMLSPLQFGIPYSRPRYFCLAKRKPSSFQNQLLNNRLLWSPSPLFGHDDNTVAIEHDQSQESWNNLLESCEPVEKFLEFKNYSDQMNTESGFLDTTIDPIDAYGALEKNDNANGHNDISLDQYLVPLSLIERWGSAMGILNLFSLSLLTSPIYYVIIYIDHLSLKISLKTLDIVYPNSKRCCCFTKSYYRYVKGTGSLLATVQPKKKGKSSSLKEQCLRFFTPTEVANLHCFPEDFHFPQHISLRQRYALLGNSLSIAVVAPLLRYLFAEPSVQNMQIFPSNGACTHSQFLAL